MITAHQIVRCCRSDRGTSVRDLESSAKYCENLSRSAAMNPRATPETAPAYREAASILQAEAESRKLALAEIDKDRDG